MPMAMVWNSNFPSNYIHISYILFWTTGEINILQIKCANVGFERVLKLNILITQTPSTRSIYLAGESSRVSLSASALKSVSALILTDRQMVSQQNLPKCYFCFVLNKPKNSHMTKNVTQIPILPIFLT